MRIVLTVITLLVLASCSTPRFAYSPNAHNVPVFTQKNDSKLAVNYSTNADTRRSEDKYSRNKSNGFDVQGAYAITDHIAVQGSYFSRNEKSSSNNQDYFDSSVIKYKRDLFEFGAGYFTPIDKKGKVHFQFYGGVGFGKFTINENGRDNNLLFYNRYHNSNLTKFYVEPAITFKSTETFAASLSTRFSIIKFRNIATNYTQAEKETFNLDSIGRNAIVFFEPAFVNSFGFNKLPGLRIEYQLGLSLLMSRTVVDNRTFNFSIGLLFDIPKLIKGATNKNDN
ncbi:hypothetical protein BH11BAC4_BH11BAC4_21100 [soil metagenome]